MIRLDLKLNDNHSLLLNSDKYSKIKNEVEEFIDNDKHLHTKAFAKDVLFSHELKANNQIEGYYDDLAIIKEIIKRKYPNIDNEQKTRILNLYHGYNYILKESNINKDNLKKLYNILSKDLLCEYDKTHMGNYFREDDVYIYASRNLADEPYMGVNYKDIEYYINNYFNFLNNDEFNNTITEKYIKSQILHYYFVFIHPYFDVNGRTSRTLALWYLINNKAIPFIIFNRGITFNRNEYIKRIIEVSNTYDITYFIRFMLKTVKIELEKESIIQNIKKDLDSNLKSQDYETLLYFLSLNGITSVNDFSTFYNRYHDKKNNKVLYETMIKPLIDLNIFEIERLSNNYMFNNIHNEILKLNDDYIERNNIKRLKKYL